jgi:XisH protein
VANDLQKMIGQLQLYQWALDEQAPDRELFLAVSLAVYERHFQKPVFKTVVARNNIKLLVIDEIKGVILQWIRP